MKLAIPRALAASVISTSFFEKLEPVFRSRKVDLTFRRANDSANCFSVSKIESESFISPSGQPVFGRNALNPEVYGHISNNANSMLCI